MEAFPAGQQFHSKKLLKSLVFFYDNRNLKISKSKKSERYFRDKIEIFIRLFDEHFTRHFESHWRETWRYTCRRNVPQISLETPPPPPPDVSQCQMSQLLLAQIDHTLSVMYAIHINIYVDSFQNRATAHKYHMAISKTRVVVPIIPSKRTAEEY